MENNPWPSAPADAKGVAMPNTHPLAVDAAGLAAMLNMGRRSIERAHATGKIPAPVRIGGARRWPVEEITGWLRVGCPHRDRWEEIKNCG